MKKIILGIVALVVIAIAAAIFYVLTNLDAIVKGAIEKYGSEATQTAVRVDRVKIKLAQGDGAIYGLTVGNPGGFELAHAISLGEMGVGIDLESIREEPYVIKHITVRDPRVFFEVNTDKKANLNELKKNLITEQPATKDRSEAGESAANEPRLIIRRITFEQGGITARVTPLNKEYELKLPNINMKSLGGNQGATPSELTREILQRLIDIARDEIRRKGIDAELDKLKSRAREKVDEEKARLKGEADRKIEEERKKAEDKLKSLLK